MAFPDAFVDEVRRTADIVHVVSDHVALKKLGASWKGLCPFHQEKTPSFNVRPEIGRFHCFGCSADGDVFKFVMLHDRLSFPEAIETLARRFGVPVPESRSDAGPDRKEREEILALMDAAAQHFTRTLWSAPGAKAREYLLGRGFKKETLETIRAGAARDAWDDLLLALRGRFSPAALLTAGLVLERQDRSGHYDRFRNRAVFPILSDSGRVVAFGARSLDGSEPKYLNSPETPVYQKSRTLYNLSGAKDAIRKEGHVVLMEGYLDVARAIECGVTEVVATCGTALTPGHARLLRRFSDRVILNFDQDEAGQKAAHKSLDILLDEGMRVQVVELPAGHDPDTYLKAQGAAAYRTRLANAPEALEWLANRAAAANDTRTPAGKAAYLQALLPFLLKVESAVERAAWVSRIAERGNLDEAATRDELRRARTSARGGRPDPESAAALVPPAPPAPRLLQAEKLFLSAILRDAPGLDDVMGELETGDFAALQAADAFRAAKAIYLRGESVTATGLLAEVKDADTQALLGRIACEEQPEVPQSPGECARELRHVALRRRLQDAQKSLERGDGETDALLREIGEIKRKMAVL
jgi:DNA primase